MNYIRGVIWYNGEAYRNISELARKTNTSKKYIYSLCRSYGNDLTGINVHKPDYENRIKIYYIVNGTEKYDNVDDIILIYGHTLTEIYKRMKQPRYIPSENAKYFDLGTLVRKKKATSKKDKHLGYYFE